MHAAPGSARARALAQGRRIPMWSMRPHVHPAAPTTPNRERSAVKDALRASRSPAGDGDCVSGRPVRAGLGACPLPAPSPPHSEAPVFRPGRGLEP